MSQKGAKLRPKGPFALGTPVDLVFMTPRRRLRVSGVVWRIDADGMAVLFLGRVPEGIDGMRWLIRTGSLTDIEC